MERIRESVQEGQLTRAGIEDALRVTVASLGREGDKHAAAELISDICDGGPDNAHLIVASGAITPRPLRPVGKAESNTTASVCAVIVMAQAWALCLLVALPVPASATESLA